MYDASLVQSLDGVVKLVLGFHYHCGHVVFNLHELLHARIARLKMAHPQAVAEVAMIVRRAAFGELFIESGLDLTEGTLRLGSGSLTCLFVFLFDLVDGSIVLGNSFGKKVGAVCDGSETGGSGSGLKALAIDHPKQQIDLPFSRVGYISS